VQILRFWLRQNDDLFFAMNFGLRMLEHFSGYWEFDRNGDCRFFLSKNGASTWVMKQSYRRDAKWESGSMWST
jgi:hypothetical protein